MAASNLWAAIDPAAAWRVAPEGYGETSTEPGRQTVDAGVSPFHPNHPQFAFGIVLGLTLAGIWYVFDHGGAGAGVKAHVGPANAGAELGIGGSKK